MSLSGGARYKNLPGCYGVHSNLTLRTPESLIYLVPTSSLLLFNKGNVTVSHCLDVNFATSYCDKCFFKLKSCFSACGKVYFKRLQCRAVHVMLPY